MRTHIWIALYYWKKITLANYIDALATYVSVPAFLLSLHLRIFRTRTRSFKSLLQTRHWLRGKKTTHKLCFYVQRIVIKVFWQWQSSYEDKTHQFTQCPVSTYKIFSVMRFRTSRYHLLHCGCTIPAVYGKDWGLRIRK